MTVHEDAAIAVLERFEEDPDSMATLMWLRRQHIDGLLNASEEFGTGYADSLGSSSRFSPKQWPFHQHAAFLKIHALIGAGDIAYTVISTGGSPSQDAAREENAKKLDHTYGPFQAKLNMSQNHADMDGKLVWREPLSIHRPTGEFFYDNQCRDAAQSILYRPATRSPGWAPLEVGDSWPSRTLLHLWQFGAVARWPYGSEVIWLFLDYSWRDGRRM